MAKVCTSISLDADLKREAQALFQDLGIDMSAAVSLFLRQAVQCDGLPFEVYRKKPNAETLAAMREVDDMIKQPEKYKTYDSFSELRQELDAEIKEEDSQSA